MRLRTDENGVVILEGVYNPVILKTDAGEELSICMRDTGFEGVYQRGNLEMKQGTVNYVNRNVESLPDAIEKLVEHLIKDEGYWESWKANIAMAMYDELKDQGYGADSLHAALNDGAQRFLEHLIGKLYTEEPVTMDELNEPTERRDPEEVEKEINSTNMFRFDPDSSIVLMYDQSQLDTVSKLPECKEGTIAILITPDQEATRSWCWKGGKWKEMFAGEDKVECTTPMHEAIREFLQDDEKSNGIGVGAYYTGRKDVAFTDYANANEFSNRLWLNVAEIYTFEDFRDLVELLCKEHDLDYLRIMDYLLRYCDFLEDYREYSSREAAEETQDDSPVDEKRLGPNEDEAPKWNDIDWEKILEEMKQYPTEIKEFPDFNTPCSFPPQPNMSHPCSGCSQYARILAGENVICHCTIGTPVVYCDSNGFGHITTGYWQVDDEVTPEGMPKTTMTVSGFPEFIGNKGIYDQLKDIVSGNKTKQDEV